MTAELFLFFLLIFSLGWFTVNIIGKKISLEERVGLSIILGFGIHSLIYYVLELYLRFALFTSLELLVGEIFLAVLINIIFKVENGYKNPVKYKFKVLDVVLILISLLVFSYSFVQSVYWPPYEPDAIHLYDFRAKRLLEGDIAGFYSRNDINQSNLYPPFTSLGHFFIYQTGSNKAKIIYPAFFFSLYLVILGYIKRLTKSSRRGLLAATLVIFTPSVWWNSFLALPNMIYMIFLSLSVMYLFEETKDKKITLGRIALGALLLGLSAWTRMELFWVVPAVVLALRSLLKIKLVNLLLFLIIFIPISFLWSISLKAIVPTSQKVVTPIHNIINTVTTVTSQSFTPGQTSAVLQHFLLPLFQSWGFILPLFIVVVFTEMLVLRRLTVFNLTSILLSLFFVVGIVVFSGWYPQWQKLDSSVYRLGIISIPLFWVSIITSPLWDRIKL